VGSFFVMFVIFVLAACLVVIPLTMIMVWKAAFSKENEMEE
jgi:hypothetical protein